jgi:FtsZ-binding cell division protein ZapB
MEYAEEMDQFQILEEKIDSLLETIAGLRRETSSLRGELKVQEEQIGGLNGEIDRLKSAQERARQRVTALLGKIEQIEG